MDKTSVKKVKATDNVSTLNEYLKLGWELLETAPGRYDDGAAYIVYSVAWTKEGSAPEPSYF